MPHRGGSTRSLLIAAAAMSLAACGTTVSGTNGGVAAPGAAGLGAPAAASAAAAGSSAGLGAAAGSPNQFAAGAFASSSGRGDAPGAGPVAGSAPAGTGGPDANHSRLVPANGAPGVTDKEVAIGYEYIESGDFNGAAGGLGLQGAAVGNTRAEAQAVIDYINAHGGVAGGRHILGLPFKQDPTADAPTHDQAACSFYTEDNHAFAAMAIDDGMDACLHKHHTVAIASGVNRDILKAYPHDVFAPGIFESFHATTQLAVKLHSYSYFDPGTKLGVMYDPDNKDGFNNAFVPTLRKFGITVADSAEVDNHSDSFAADVQGVELKFASDGVDHVVILDNDLLALVFMQQAQSQHYHPRYGLWSGNEDSILQSQAFASDQLPRSIEMGWNPGLDVDQAHLQPNAAQKLCDEIMHARGLAAVSSLDHGLQLAYCATFFWAQEALDAATGLDTANFQAAVESLRNPILSAAISYAESWSAAKHWGTGAVRMTAYDTSCSCFVYRSGILLI